MQTRPLKVASRGSSRALLCAHVADPYVKVWLMHKDKRVEKKKTVTMKRCLNPVFNESFPFDVPAHVLRETTIIITVMDKDRLSRNDVIGKVGLRASSLHNVTAVYGKSGGWGRGKEGRNFYGE